MTGGTALEAWLIRHRAWVVMGVLVVALVVVGVTGIGAKGTSGGASSASRPRTVFGSRVAPPVPSRGLAMVNGWTAMDAGEVVGVYAGSEPADHQNGLLEIERTVGRRIRVYSIVLPRTGPVTLLKPPTVDTMLAAEQATLHLVTADGGLGTLNLVNDRVSLAG
jgi:hypothetical protein